MAKLLKITLCVAMLATMLIGVANAGQNSGGSAKLYWLSSGAATVPLAARNSTANTVYALVTATGLVNFRGADVQIYINSLSQTGLPDAWQFQTGGCAEGFYTAKIGGWKTGSSTIWPNVFTATPAVPGTVAAQGGAMYYSGLTETCVSPHQVGVIWLSDAGSSGVTRLNTKEYGVFGFSLALDGGCPGDNIDPAGPIGVCINPNWRLPCGSGEKGNVMVTVDGTGTKDYLPFSAGFQWLTWQAGAYTTCPGVTPVGKTTWGKVRKLYH